MNALDQEILRVSRLPPGKYRLTIDKRMVGDCDADQLASGINLARRDTPMLEQSILVAFDSERKNDIEKARFNLIQQEMDANARDVASKLGHGSNGQWSDSGTMPSQSLTAIRFPWFREKQASASVLTIRSVYSR